MAGGTIRKLLIVRQDKLGDLLTTTPALRALKLARPDLHVTVWIPKSLEPVLRHNPYVDAAAFTTFRPTFRQCLAHLQFLRRERFDAAVFVKSRAGTHIPLTWLARIPRRIGSTEKSYGRFLTTNLSLPWDEMSEHEAELSYRVLEEAIGQKLGRVPMDLIFTEAEAEAARALVGEGPYFVVHPGTGGTGRAWLPESYANIIRAIRESTGLRCLITGTESERPLADALATQAGATSVAGKTDVLTLAALLAGSELLIAGSTGTMHIGASQQTPTLLIEPTPDASQRIGKWAPWMAPHRAVGATAVCSGCDAIQCHQTGMECVKSISTERVLEASLALLAGKKIPNFSRENGKTALQ